MMDYTQVVLAYNAMRDMLHASNGTQLDLRPLSFPELFRPKDHTDSS